MRWFFFPLLDFFFFLYCHLLYVLVWYEASLVLNCLEFFQNVWHTVLKRCYIKSYVITSLKIRKSEKSNCHVLKPKWKDSIPQYFHHNKNNKKEMISSILFFIACYWTWQLERNTILFLVAFCFPQWRKIIILLCFVLTFFLKFKTLLVLFTSQNQWYNSHLY